MIAFLDMPSGISGDMFLGCLVDAGWPISALRETVERLALPTGAWRVDAAPVMRGPLQATLVDVEVDEGDSHRHLSDIRRLILAADLPTPVQEKAVAVFSRLAQAEAGVHGTGIEEVHFHEVGALDAIIDIVGVVAGLHELGIDQLYASGVPLGEGWTSSAHGRIPLPAPATLALLAQVGARNRPAPGPGELVTPTGAALLAELATFSQPLISLDRIGLGAGRKEFEWPNVARLWLGESEGTGELVELQTNIDDMNPELYAAVSARLFVAGALDVWMAPIQMKKSRPGVLLTVLSPAQHEQVLADLLLRETTTLGVRCRSVRRYEATREFRRIVTPFGEVSVKLKWVDGAISGAKPEYDECVELADSNNVPTRTVYEAAQSAAHQAFLAPEN